MQPDARKKTLGNFWEEKPLEAPLLAPNLPLLGARPRCLRALQVSGTCLPPPVHNRRLDTQVLGLRATAGGPARVTGGCRDLEAPDELQGTLALTAGTCQLQAPSKQSSPQQPRHWAALQKTRSRVKWRTALSRYTMRKVLLLRSLSSTNRSVIKGKREKSSSPALREHNAASSKLNPALN